MEAAVSECARPHAHSDTAVMTATRRQVPWKHPGQQATAGTAPR
ncbi:hypothetical protein HMPREF0058_0631 [Actinomyces urogenitalis DSM 15434]|uniref:Uncharacterized protein n=1 Tax=Actinomyces urogenitalis DSM 15434 TaxID=525246 RepID=C0W437_9ACTO|nr:hypothetical protein HMPREF0058_0631 [Actinomyces urogenitalis DSM 15434]